MKLSAILAPLIAANVPGDVILATVRAYEDEREDALEKRRDSDRVRQQAKRSRESRDTKTTSRDRQPSAPHVRVEGSSSKKEISEQEEKEVGAPAARSNRGTRLPSDFEPNMADAVDAGLAEGEAWREFEKFKDYWRAQPGQRGVKLDWPATWRNWCRNARGNRPSQPRAASPPLPHKPRNAGESARMELQRRGQYPDATSHPARLEDESDGNAGFAGTDIARRIALAASR